MSLWLGDADATVLLALCEHHGPRIKDEATRAAVLRAAATLREKLDPNHRWRSHRRKDNADASRRYRERKRAAADTASPCPAG